MRERRERVHHSIEPAPDGAKEQDVDLSPRYKKTYKITKKELEYLAGRVRKLQRLTRKICREKIASFA